MRVLEPELLDHLPATDERAQQSRRDLIKLNRVMGHTRLMLQMMRGADFNTLIDLGTGDGQFARRVVGKLGRTCRLILVDQQRVSTTEDIVVMDVMEFLRTLKPQAGIAIMANLFLHHFADDALRELFAEAAQKSDWFFACEPRRSRISLAAVRLLPLIRCNAVTRHDALASIRAGFADKELATLWLRENSWRIKEFEGGFASHCFMASRQRT